VSLWLTEEELVQLTGYKSKRKQREALGELRVIFRVRPQDGFPLVDRSQFETHPVLTRHTRRREPRLDLLS